MSQPVIPTSYPKLSTQLGILFGFVGLFILSASTYTVLWKLYNKREEKAERARELDLKQRGFGVMADNEKGQGGGRGAAGE